MIGHKKQWQFLIKSIELGKLPHALLFYGQEQVGKKTLAIELAKRLINNDIIRRIHPDFVFLRPENKSIQIAQIRNVIEKLSFKPYSAECKVAVIDNAHLMTKEAQNCFLKFLEEPGEKTFLFLITEHPETLLSTILSRVQKIRFSPVENKEIEKYLLENKISKSKISELNSLILGRPGMAIDFIADPQKIKDQRKLIADLVKVIDSDLSFRFQYAKVLSDKKSNNNLKNVLDVWLRYLRNSLISKINKEGIELSTYSVDKLKEVIKEMQSTKFLLTTTNVNSKLALEVLLMKL